MQIYLTLFSYIGFLLDYVAVALCVTGRMGLIL